MAKRGGRGWRGALAVGAVAGAVLVAQGAQGVGPAVALGPLPTPVVLLSVTVTPPAASITAGGTQQFSATGVYSDLSSHDITSSVTWSSSDPTVATVSNTNGSRGRATGVAAGGATITATDPTTGMAGTALLAVSALPPPPPPTLVAVVVSPPAASVEQGATQQFTATGTYSDLSTADLTGIVTWSSSDPTVASISNTSGSRGRATGVAAGGATITATDSASGSAGTAVLTVTPPVVIPPIIPPVVPPVSTSRMLVITPNAGQAGTAVRIVGVRFPLAHKVRVSYQTGGHPRQVKLCKTGVAGNGTFVCSGFIPAVTKAGAAGAHTVVAKVVRAKGTPVTKATFTLLR